MSKTVLRRRNMPDSLREHHRIPGIAPFLLSGDKSLACAKAVSVEPKPNPRWVSDPEGPTRRNTLPRYVAGSADRASECVFLRSNAGSFEVFQVRTRWAVSPSRRSSRRTHSSVTGGSSFRRRQYSASLGTDQTENGNPRSEGLDKATSTSSRSCAARKMGGRPLGLGTCSKVANPLSLKRWAQSYATVKWQPTRSAASSRLNPRRTWSMMRYRWWTRTERVKSLSLDRNTRCSLRVRGRSFRCRAILSSQENRIAHIRLYKLE